MMRQRREGSVDYICDEESDSLLPEQLSILHADSRCPRC